MSTMIGIMISLLILVGLSCYMVTMSYMRTRDVVAAKVGGDAFTEILDRQKYSLFLHFVAIVIMVAYTGTLV